MDAPAWMKAHLAPGERLVWAQGPPPGAAWGAVGPLVGAGFALAFAGPALIDLPGAWSWLLDPLKLSERAGVPSLVLALAGALGFVSLVAKHAVLFSLEAWALTDRRLVRVIRYVPFASRSWPLSSLRVERVKLRRKGASLTLRVARPHLWEGTLSLRARENAAVVVDALSPPRDAPDSAPADATLA